MAATAAAAAAVMKSKAISKIVKIVAPIVVAGVVAVGTLVVTILGGSMSSEGMTEAANTRRVPEMYLPMLTDAAGHCDMELSPLLIATIIDADTGWNPLFESPDADGEVRAGLGAFTPANWAQWAETPDADPQGRFQPDLAIKALGRELCHLTIEVSLFSKADAMVQRDLVAVAHYAGLDVARKAGATTTDPAVVAYLAATTASRSAFLAQFGSGTGTDFGLRVVETARTAIGLPYVWGGGTINGPSGANTGGRGFDCSGLVLWAVYVASDGEITLPHLAKTQGGLGELVGTGVGLTFDQSVLAPGDIIAFNLTGRVGSASTDYDHVGIYIGEGQMLHAPQLGSTVSSVSLNTNYWLGKTWTVRRHG